ncbi:MAG: hypothetical protein L3J33_00150 [Rhodobacteraceae bacterium]|nr:hypothetical protein [Paracoccaceae bacterium]
MVIWIIAGCWVWHYRNFLYADVNGAVLIVWDDIWFQPIIYNYAENGRLTHPFLSPIAGNPSGELLWHGWLMPSLAGEIQSWFTGLAGIAQAKFSSHLIVLLTFWGYALFCFFRFGAFKAIICLPIFLGLFLYQAGRPELVASVILLVFFWGVEWRNLVFRTALIVSCISAVAVTSPVLAVYLALIGGIILFSSDMERKLCWLVVLAQIVLVPFGIFLLTLLFTDIALLDWVAGIIEHAKRISSRTDGSFGSYFLMNSRLPLMILLIILLVLLGAERCFSCRKPEVWVGFFTLIILVYFTSIRVPTTVYNIGWLLPFVIFIVPSGSRIIGRIQTVILVWLSAAFVLSIGLNSILTIKNINEGVPAEKLSLAVQELSEKAIFLTDKYSLSGNALIGGIERQYRFTVDPSGADYRISFQAISNRAAPEISATECLVYSTFQQVPLKLFGTELWYSRGDWAFSIIQIKNCP